MNILESFSGSRAKTLGFEKLENRLLLTRSSFHVVDNVSSASYTYAGDSLTGSFALATNNDTVRGIASTPDGGTFWTIDLDREVFVYDGSGTLLGSWRATGLAIPEGIAIHGNDVWIVSRGTDEVFRFAGGALYTSGEYSPDSSFALDPQNSDPWGMTTDGESIWVVNDRLDQWKVFKYDVAGALLGSWTLDEANKNARGITLDPSNPDDLLVANDGGLNSVFRYTNGAVEVSGSLSASETIELTAANQSPSGIAAFITAGSDTVVDFDSDGDIDGTDYLVWQRQAGSTANQEALRRLLADFGDRNLGNDNDLPSDAPALSNKLRRVGGLHSGIPDQMDVYHLPVAEVSKIELTTSGVMPEQLEVAILYDRDLSGQADPDLEVVAMSRSNVLETVLMPGDYFVTVESLVPGRESFYRLRSSMDALSTELLFYSDVFGRVYSQLWSDDVLLYEEKFDSAADTPLETTWYVSNDDSWTTAYATAVNEVSTSGESTFFEQLFASPPVPTKVSAIRDHDVLTSKSPTGIGLQIDRVNGTVESISSDLTAGEAVEMVTRLEEVLDSGGQLSGYQLITEQVGAAGPIIVQVQEIVLDGTRTVTFPSGHDPSTTITQVYDSLGMLESISEVDPQAGLTTLFSFSYDSGGELIEVLANSSTDLGEAMEQTRLYRETQVVNGELTEVIVEEGEITFSDGSMLYSYRVAYAETGISIWSLQRATAPDGKTQTRKIGMERGDSSDGPFDFFDVTEYADSTGSVLYEIFRTTRVDTTTIGRELNYGDITAVQDNALEGVAYRFDRTRQSVYTDDSNTYFERTLEEGEVASEAWIVDGWVRQQTFTDGSFESFYVDGDLWVEVRGDADQLVTRSVYVLDDGLISGPEFVDEFAAIGGDVRQTRTVYIDDGTLTQTFVNGTLTSESLSRGSISQQLYFLNGTAYRRVFDSSLPLEEPVIEETSYPDGRVYRQVRTYSDVPSLIPLYDRFEEWYSNGALTQARATFNVWPPLRSVVRDFAPSQTSLALWGEEIKNVVQEGGRAISNGVGTIGEAASGWAQRGGNVWDSAGDELDRAIDVIGETVATNGRQWAEGYRRVVSNISGAAAEVLESYVNGPLGAFADQVVAAYDGSRFNGTVLDNIDVGVSSQPPVDFDWWDLATGENLGLPTIGSIAWETLEPGLLTDIGEDFSGRIATLWPNALESISGIGAQVAQLALPGVLSQVNLGPIEDFFEFATDNFTEVLEVLGVDTGPEKHYSRSVCSQANSTSLNICIDWGSADGRQEFNRAFPSILSPTGRTAADLVEDAAHLIELLIQDNLAAITSDSGELVLADPWTGAERTINDPRLGRNTVVAGVGARPLPGFASAIATQPGLQTSAPPQWGRGAGSLKMDGTTVTRATISFDTTEPAYTRTPDAAFFYGTAVHEFLHMFGLAPTWNNWPLVLAKYFAASGRPPGSNYPGFPGHPAFPEYDVTPPAPVPNPISISWRDFGAADPAITYSPQAADDITSADVDMLRIIGWTLPINGNGIPDRSIFLNTLSATEQNFVFNTLGWQRPSPLTTIASDTRVSEGFDLSSTIFLPRDNTQLEPNSIKWGNRSADANWLVDQNAVTELWVGSGLTGFYLGGCGCGGVGCAACRPAVLQEPQVGGCGCGGFGCPACLGTMWRGYEEIIASYSVDSGDSGRPNNPSHSITATPISTTLKSSDSSIIDAMITKAPERASNSTQRDVNILRIIGSTVAVDSSNTLDKDAVQYGVPQVDRDFIFSALRWDRSSLLSARVSKTEGFEYAILASIGAVSSNAAKENLFAEDEDSRTADEVMIDWSSLERADWRTDQRRAYEFHPQRSNRWHNEEIEWLLAASLVDLAFEEAFMIESP